MRICHVRKRFELCEQYLEPLLGWWFGLPSKSVSKSLPMIVVLSGWTLSHGAKGLPWMPAGIRRKLWRPYRLRALICSLKIREPVFPRVDLLQVHKRQYVKIRRVLLFDESVEYALPILILLILFGLLALLALAWLIWKLWPRRKKGTWAACGRGVRECTCGT